MKEGGVSNNAPLRIQQTRGLIITGTQVKCAQKMDIVYKMLLVVFKEQQGKAG
jgi:hypothetical protein